MIRPSSVGVDLTMQRCYPKRRHFSHTCARADCGVLGITGAPSGFSDRNNLMRTLGVEEEFLVVDPQSGMPLPLGDRIVAASAKSSRQTSCTLTTELQSEQVESITPVCHSLDELGLAIRAGRAYADDLARSLGARIVALGTSPIPLEPHIVPTSRYREIGNRFGLTAREQLTCGCHVHVAVESAEEGIAVLDRIRVWLPVLLALSANSPYWSGHSTGYASYRQQMLSRLPLTGATEEFGSVKSYRDQIAQFISSDVILDEGMVYFDARLSRLHPTVEIRVSDVCLDADTAVLIAGLTRALVETAAQEWRLGVPPMAATAPLINLAMWRASRDGLDGALLTPGTWQPQPAEAVVTLLRRRLGPALDSLGDTERIDELLADHLAIGTGDRDQRAWFGRSADLACVVAKAVERTHDNARRPV